MRWKISDAKGSGVDYIGHAETTPVDEAINELWRKYLQDAAPINAEMEWDHLRVEMWLDSGRLILFPTPWQFRHRVEKAACQIICSDLLNFYETLIEADMPDDKFEVALIRKEQEIVGLLSASASGMKVPERLSRQSVRILYYGADLEKPIREDRFSRS